MYDSTWHEALIRAGLEPDKATQLIEMTNLSLRGLGLNIAREPGVKNFNEKLAFVRSQLRHLINPGK